MNNLTEDSIEQAFIDQLKSQGYSYRHGSEIAPNSDNPEREGFDGVLLENQLKKSLKNRHVGTSFNRT